MKFVLTDKIKHRIVGLVVIISLIAILMPAVIKKSNYSLDEKVKLSLNLPEKPPIPVIDAPNQEQLFETVKVAHVEIQPVNQIPPLPKLVKAEPITTIPTVKKAVQIAKVDLPKNTTVIKKIIRSKNAVVASALTKEHYAVQLASFAKKDNAIALVTKLKNQGYKASFSSSKNGALFKVQVGLLAERSEALSLQKKLAATTKLSGFIVKAEVS